MTNLEVWLVKSETTNCVVLVATHALMDGRGMIMFIDKLLYFIDLAHRGMLEGCRGGRGGGQERGRRVRGEWEGVGGEGKGIKRERENRESEEYE
jgi:hypothetical protein